MNFASQWWQLLVYYIISRKAKAFFITSLWPSVKTTPTLGCALKSIVATSKASLRLQNLGCDFKFLAATSKSWLPLQSLDSCDHRSDFKILHWHRYTWFYTHSFFLNTIMDIWIMDILVASIKILSLSHCLVAEPDKVLVGEVNEWVANPLGPV